MSFSSGTFSLYSPGNPVVTGTTIASTWANNTLNDIATGLSTCVLKDGTQTITANIPMSTYKFTGLGAGTATGNSVRFEQVLSTSSPAGSIAYAATAGATQLTYAAALNKLIYGLTYSNNGADATNDIDIATGGAIDATGAYWMTLTAMTKRSDANWSVGTNQGALDTGAVGNSDYYIWLIARSDTGVVDILFSLSSTAPTMPASYDFKRLIGWFRRTGGAIITFTTTEINGGGINYAEKSSPMPIDSAALTTARLASALTGTPQAFSVQANIRYFFGDAGGAIVIIQCPDETDAAPSATAAPGLDVSIVGGTGIAGFKTVRTSATGTIAARASAAVDAYRVFVQSWDWSRR